jgi:cell division protein FtsL
MPEGDAKEMARRRKFSNSEKAFYLLSLVIVISMVLGLIAVAITPG